jgi:hypothetical protein
MAKLRRRTIRTKTKMYGEKTVAPNKKGNHRNKPEKIYEINRLFYDENLSKNKMAAEHGYGPTAVEKYTFVTRDEWEKYKNTFTGVLNPEYRRETHDK